MNWLSHNKVKILSTLTLVSLLFCVPQITIAYDGETVINEILWTVVVGLFGKVLWAAGLLLNFTVENFVIGFGAYYASSGIGSAIDTLWGSVRDIINLTFIFGLVYIGFKMILDSSDSSAKKMLGSLLIAAILINFSLFITKTVVDFSNIAAKQFAGQFEDKTTEIKNDYDVSGKFTELLGVQKTFSEKDLGEGGAIGYILGTMWLIAVAAFVFLAGGILLLIRFVVLNIYLLLSPLMFLGFIFPGVGDTFKKYWSGFLGRAFFAPAYLLMIYFSYNILVKLEAGLRKKDLLAGDRSDNFAALSGSDPVAATQSFEGMIIYFILVCVFLIASLVVANKMGAHGASSAIALGKKWSNNIRNGTRRLATKPFRAVGQEIGKQVSYRAGNLLSSNLRKMENYQGKGGKVVRFMARTNMVQDGVGGAATGMQNAKFGSKRTVEQDRRKREQTNSRADARFEIENNPTPPPVNHASSSSDDITRRQNDRTTQQARVQRLSDEEIKEMARVNTAALLDQEFASLLSDAQIKSLEDSGILSSDDVDKLKERRDTGTFTDINETLISNRASNENINRALDDLNKVMSTISNDRLKGMNQALLTSPNIASKLTDDQIKFLETSGSKTPVEIQAIKNARTAAQLHTIQNGTLANTFSLTPPERTNHNDKQRRNLFKNAEAAAKLPVTVLSHPESQKYISPEIIKAFLRNNPSQDDIDSVHHNISDYVHGAHTPPEIANSWRKFGRTVEGIRFGVL